MKKTVVSCVAVLVFVLVAMAVSGKFDAFMKTSDDSHAMDRAFFSLKFPDANGTMQQLSQWKGQHIVLNFWATWCTPCRDEMPEFSELHSEYAEQNVVFIGIATDDIEKMQGFAEEINVAYPLLAGELQTMNLSREFGNVNGVLPYTVILDKTGQVVNRFTGRVPKAQLKKAVGQLFTISE